MMKNSANRPDGTRNMRRHNSEAPRPGIRKRKRQRKRCESSTNEERFMPFSLFIPWLSLNSTEATAVNVAQREPMSSVPGGDHGDLFVLDQGHGPHRQGA